MLPAAFSMTKPFSFNKSHRLLKNAQFQYAYRRGRSYSHQSMVLIVAKSRGKTRVGFSVGKKVGNSVKRSRAKRLLRESYRLQRPMLRSGLSLIFVAKAPLLETPFAQVQTIMGQLLGKAGCYRNELDTAADH
jgi:ribonuclease P protein component